ncbi:hypothetical protein NDU88_004327 [Pleurodeles waltl]|uniref:Uncharacterized protein n=1 Tax=Pleurodeles waltl TaxID=8319 RepID=A0AAV7V394_PLEWA|nr:hypothetical protein NDU88_004327 [Pleurodeles waltl]
MESKLSMIVQCRAAAGNMDKEQAQHECVKSIRRAKSVHERGDAPLLLSRSNHRVQSVHERALTLRGFCLKVSVERSLFTSAHDAPLLLSRSIYRAQSVHERTVTLCCFCLEVSMERSLFMSVTLRCFYLEVSIERSLFTSAQ